MRGEDRTQRYFSEECTDFDASYNNPHQIKDIVRRLTYSYNKKGIDGRLNSLLALIGDGIAGSKILDVGCGPGAYSIKLSKKGALVTAIDYAQGMIDAAKANAKNAAARINFITANFMDFDFSNRFDYVFATGVFDYIGKSEQKEFLRKMAALSNKYVLISFPKKFTLHAFIRIIWLFFLKRIKTYYYTNRDIVNLSSSCNLKEVDRRQINTLRVIKFKKEG